VKKAHHIYLRDRILQYGGINVVAWRGGVTIKLSKSDRGSISAKKAANNQR